MEKTLRVLETPRVWPEWPYLRVERRKELRPGSPYCVVIANELHDVEPTVYFTDSWPIDEQFTAEREKSMPYPNLIDLAQAGWRPFYLVR